MTPAVTSQPRLVRALLGPGVLALMVSLAACAPSTSGGSGDSTGSGGAPSGSGGA